MRYFRPAQNDALITMVTALLRGIGMPKTDTNNFQRLGSAHNTSAKISKTWRARFSRFKVTS